MRHKFFLAFLPACFIASIISAQNKLFDYENAWEKTDSLITKKGLTQSALEEVNKIYTTAKKEKNEPQVIKSLLYKMTLLEQRNEDAAVNNIKMLEKEISSSSQPAASILLSIEAETYWAYFQQHRWQLYNRTATINFKKEDITTWGLDDFHKKIGELYAASVKENKLLQQTKLEPFDAIIIKGNVRYLRPTLYDLLAHRALAYFKNDERDINKPAFVFEMSDPAIFAANDIFSTHHFSSIDSVSIHFKALLLFQQILQFHLHDNRPDALLDVDIERIEFAYQYGVMDDKAELYMASLKHITDQYPNLPAAAQAWYLQAQYYAGKASMYNPITDTANRYAYLQAEQICENVTNQTDSSEGKSNCKNLLNDILRKELRMETEKVNVPGLPFRSLVNYRNFNRLYCRILKLDKRTKEKLTSVNNEDNYWKTLAEMQPLKSFDQSLPETKDHQTHAVEIKIDALEPGDYMLFTSVDPDFNIKKNTLAAEGFYVSNIAYIQNKNDYFVLDRQSGRPLQGVDVQAWYRYYEPKQNKYLQRKGENFNTDKNGFFHINPPKTKTNINTDFILEFTGANDYLFMNDDRDYYAHSRYEDNADDTIATMAGEFETGNSKTFFFTDRSIYRPGQTVYFKGVVVTKDFNTQQYKILSQFKSKVILVNANDEKIDSISVITNEYGSYHGKFRLPENQLNGEFKIKDEFTSNEQSFSVEEYKRPKFFVEFDTVRGSYRLNDTIKITGEAKAYAGNVIDGATVKYRVTRQARFPYPWLYWKIAMPSSAQQEIAHGEIKTNAEGKFFIQFPALPDLSISKTSSPEFEYRLTADITDINGETRSGETYIKAGYKSLDLSITEPSEENLPADSLHTISVMTENLSGKFEPAKVDIAIYRLRTPERLIRERYWGQPDQFVMTKEQYLQYFPHDEYSDETKKESWEKIGKALEFSDSTRENRKFDLQNTSLSPGWYLIEVTAKDKYGEEVKNVKYIQLTDTKTGRPATPGYNWSSNNNYIVDVGSEAKVSIGSSADSVFVIQQTDKKSAGENPGWNTYSYLSLNNQKKTISLPVTESDRGGYGIYFAFVKDNRFFTGTNAIYVPWTNKELKISYETFRDKTLPGSNEKWTIKISGYKKDKVAAEVVTAMYDASLDQFSRHNWPYPNLFPNYYTNNKWDYEFDFSAKESIGKYEEGGFPVTFIKNYDEFINTITYNQLLTRNIYQRRGASPQVNQVAFALQGKASSLQIEMVKASPPKIVADDIELKDVILSQKLATSAPPSTQIRKNFNETAFFFPDLQTDSSGNITFSFSVPEALTQWKWMTFAHTKDLETAYSEKTLVTQKQLMVQANAPRFLREGDKMEFSIKIVNLSDSEITGQVSLQLINTMTNQPVDGQFINRMPNQYFTASPKQSTSISFPFEVPYQYSQPLTYRVVATAPITGKKAIWGEASDAEESTLPVLSNRTLVTESIPFTISSGTKKIQFEKLLHSGESETLNNHALTVEFSSNPAWYAVQALPYLMEFPYECSEQTFNRFYANALASTMVNSSPRIKEIFDRWKGNDTAALLSNLQKDEELKSVLLEETPWVLEAKTESQQKKNISLLFDMVKMNNELASALGKLQQLQLSNGGFAWFRGGPDDRYITQYILTGIGHLKKLKSLPSTLTEKISSIITPAIAYLDGKLKQDYEEWKKHNKTSTTDENLGYTQIQYLYMRSFFSEYAIPGDVFTAVNYYRKQAQQYWLHQNKYMQGMIALSLYRTGDIKTAKDIIASLKQNAIVNPEKGMYWKKAEGYYWFQAPIETQSLLIEAFSEISHDASAAANMKTWLLQQKQSQNWATTKATADACYALLLQGTDWLGTNREAEIKLGDEIIQSKNETQESGTGYFKKTIDGPSVKPNMGNISISLSSPGEKGQVAAWGAIYWQYFENMDKISASTGSKMPVMISKKIFIEKNTDRGPVLEPVNDNGNVKIGDKIKVRIEIKADRDLEYVHMKDLRAACTEPVDVLSHYVWQGGLGYYETTKDASTSFFFNYLPKGTHVFEYALFVNAAGNFSNGITTIQCMYAPEFAAHSDGIKITSETSD